MCLQAKTIQDLGNGNLGPSVAHNICGWEANSREPANQQWNLKCASLRCSDVTGTTEGIRWLNMERMWGHSVVECGRGWVDAGSILNHLELQRQGFEKKSMCKWTGQCEEWWIQILKKWVDVGTFLNHSGLQAKKSMFWMQCCGARYFWDKLTHASKCHFAGTV